MMIFILICVYDETILFSFFFHFRLKIIMMILMIIMINIIPLFKQGSENDIRASFIVLRFK